MLFQLARVSMTIQRTEKKLKGFLISSGLITPNDRTHSVIDRCTPGIVMVMFLGIATAAGSEQLPFPLYEKGETIESYARRASLDARKSVDLGEGVALEAVLIPAAKFSMGSRPPQQANITIAGSQVLIAIGVICVLALIMNLFRKPRGRRKSFSLSWLLLITIASGLIVAGSARWYLAIQRERKWAHDMSVYEELPSDEKPAHMATIALPFYMGKFLVTQRQYESLMKSNPSHFKGPELPVDSVSKDDAVSFCNRLNDQFKRQLGDLHVQLPSEIQWEFACRGGTDTAFYVGDVISTDEANFDGTIDSPFLSAFGKYRRQTTPVNTFKPNPFSLYDMHGNVQQWCDDERPAKIRGPNTISVSNDCMLRGGCFSAPSDRCRSARRDSAYASTRIRCIGIRVVLVFSKVAPEK
ncbi:MAG TPA: formylglycine-generating enzyme family protein [Planctomycetota bacterium]|nr:formylglycine-generating enzyme family protein [Planctomycetota bacterium]